MGMIEDFIARYTKEYDFYSQAARLAEEMLQANLQAAGIRSIVTSRAKSIVRLEAKCRQRAERRGGYETIDEIFEDIVDLAGVRVALYFPAESEQVDGIITRLFQLVENKKVFPDPDRKRTGKRFAGYKAVHYRIHLREQDLSGPEKRYASARVEVQVASVLMHAWAEVDHDLVYKPLAGELSEEEHAILDQLNGLVMAGEISLERLQKSGEARVAVNDRKIANHYDLAVHLLGRAPEITGRPIGESGLGRVDLLFNFLTKLGIDTPGQLAPYIAALHGDVEVRPLAEQIIDTLLTEDADRYAVYNLIGHPGPLKTVEDSKEADRQFGAFINRWIGLEMLITRLTAEKGIDGPFYLNSRRLAELNLLNDDMLNEFDRLRRLRNNLIHGREYVTSADLSAAAQRIEAIAAEIERRSRSQDPNAGPALCTSIRSQY